MPETATATLYVNVYEVDRHYGGPEEGGWYYDAGDPVESHPVDTEGAADRLVEHLEQEYPRTDSSSSVIYRGGDYRVWIEDHPAKAYPEVVPHYE